MFVVFDVMNYSLFQVLCILQDTLEVTRTMILVFRLCVLILNLEEVRTFTTAHKNGSGIAIIVYACRAGPGSKKV